MTPQHLLMGLSAWPLAAYLHASRRWLTFWQRRVAFLLVIAGAGAVGDLLMRLVAS